MQKALSLSRGMCSWYEQFAEGRRVLNKKLGGALCLFALLLVEASQEARHVDFEQDGRKGHRQEVGRHLGGCALADLVQDPEHDVEALLVLFGQLRQQSRYLHAFGKVRQ